MKAIVKPISIFEADDQMLKEISVKECDGNISQAARRAIRFYYTTRYTNVPHPKIDPAPAPTRTQKRTQKQLTSVR